MKAKATFSIIGVIALLIVGLCIPTANLAQEKSESEFYNKKHYVATSY